MQNFYLKSYAKINIFLKIVGYENGYHSILSRFEKVKNLYDEVYFKLSKNSKFKIIGCEDIPLEANTIYRSYLELYKYTKNENLIKFFENYTIIIKKNIPQKSGLGGGSSNAGEVILFLNKECNLNLSLDKLVNIGTKVGYDIPFFLYNYDSANISGRGDIIKKFKSENLKFDIYTPKNISCDTSIVYKTFKKNFIISKNIEDNLSILKLKSSHILKKLTIEKANDLYKASLKAYPELKKINKNKYFFSGSGSSFFKIKD